jgi:hypothetical protein
MALSSIFSRQKKTADLVCGGRRFAGCVEFPGYVTRIHTTDLPARLARFRFVEWRIVRDMRG